MQALVSGDYYFTPAPVLKHLPGQHDQEAHGRKISEAKGNLKTTGYVYHGTDWGRLESIGKYGLRPNEQGNPLNFHESESASEYYSGPEGLVIRVKLASIDDYIHDKITHRFWTESSVDPSRIEVRTITGWKPLDEVIDTGVEKHLPDQHDQKRHGVRRAAVVVVKWSDKDKKAVGKLLGKYGTEAEIAKAFSGGLDKLPKGSKFTIEVETYYRSNEARIKGFVVYHNDIIADFERTIKKTKGKIVVHHDSFFVSRRYRNRGYGTEFYLQSENAYKRWGVDQIRLWADVSVGAYAWARMGFGFSNKRQLNNVKRWFDDAWLDLGDKIGKRNFDKAVRAVRSFRYPYQFAALTVQSGSRVIRIGKEVLLENSNIGWDAIKYLGRKSDLNRVADSYYHKRQSKLLPKPIKSMSAEIDDPEDHDLDDAEWLDWVNKQEPETLIREELGDYYQTPEER